MNLSSPCETRDSIKDIWGPRTPYKGKWPDRVDEHTTDKPDKWVQSACVLCSNGCGMDIGVKDGKIVGVRGRASDRVNHGRLGPKGLHSWHVNHHKDRLTHPFVRRNGKLERATWDEAMGLIVERTKAVQKELGNHGIGFYTSGQLFLEEYYALAMVGKAGLGTLHMDGNTRLCTATAATSMRESFGCDGQPGSYTDIDVTDCIFMVGHNMSATQTVLWTRILDRLAGQSPPKLVVIDPRRTSCAQNATVHIAPNIGTNLAVLNGIQHLLFKNGWVNEDFISKHTVGVDDLRKVCEKYTPEVVEKISGVPAATLIEAASVIGQAKSLLSTALQGVYQSNQATASACAVNNVNLLRGMIGRPGCGIYQMNGQPTAQNNREAGCNGEYPGFRNPKNKKHMQELADIWNIELHKLPHWGDPVHIMNMLHFIETDSMKMFWVSGTNPAVSLPELERVRRLFTKPDLFLVCQDIFMTETAQLADVVLPAAMWAEKTGCFTNVDRTVHISHKAVEPPGECKSDFDIFVDYAKRMNFRNKEGGPLIPWKTSEDGYKAWQVQSKGRPCDYSAMSYEKLSGGSGIQWPCNAEYPNGKDRLYHDFKFMTSEEDCEDFGHDMETGTPLNADQYRLLNPNGRAILKSCHYRPQEEAVNEEYPLRLATGRRVYHFHTRTKTGRSQKLQEREPDAWVQVNEDDAKQFGISSGDLVNVISRRGSVELPARIGEIDAGQVFIPFHFGYFDSKDGRSRAANELTLSGWDPISKQPYFKGGAVKIVKASPNVIIYEKQSKAMEAASSKKPTTQKRHRHLEDVLGLFEANNGTLLDLYTNIRSNPDMDVDIRSGLGVMIEFATAVQERFAPFIQQYGRVERKENNLLVNALFPDMRFGKTPFDVMMNLQGLYMYLCSMKGWLLTLTPSASAMHDKEFTAAVLFVGEMLDKQMGWVQMNITVKAPQTLIVPSMNANER